MRAESQGINITKREALDKSIEVMKATMNNRSSMLQDVKRGRPTEIDSINLKIVEMGSGSGYFTEQLLKMATNPQIICVKPEIHFWCMQRNILERK